MKNFTGARGLSVVHSPMTKWALFAVAGFLGCSFSLSAQNVDLLAFQPSQNGANSRAVSLSTLNGASYGYPAVTLLDGRRLSLTNSYAWIEPTPEALPTVTAEEPRRVHTIATTIREPDSKVVTEQHNLFDYVHGEVTVLYGQSVGGGKFRRDVERGSVFGVMGNDRTQISVGAFYDRSNSRFPRY